MRKIIFSILTMAVLTASAQSTLDQRVALARDGEFAQKLKMAMVSVSIGILSAPLPKDSTEAVLATLKKEFCRGIVLGQNVDKYTFALIASGQVSTSSNDQVL